jgi:hypothetical protein
VGPLQVLLAYNLVVVWRQFNPMSSKPPSEISGIIGQGIHGCSLEIPKLSRQLTGSPLCCDGEPIAAGTEALTDVAVAGATSIPDWP